MIKKILTLLLIIMICGCSNRISLNSQLEELGYSDADIVLISKLKYEDSRLFYKSYNQRLLDLIYDSRFVKEKSGTYLMYYREYDKDTLFFLINNDYLNENNHKVIRQLFNNQYFIKSNLGTYIEYYDKFDDLDKLISYVNVGAYRVPYVEYVESDTSDPLLVLGNKWNYLGEYEPEDLIIIDKKYGVASHDQKLRPVCYDAFLKMREDALKDGVTMYITSAYRSQEYQVSIYGGYLARDPQEVVDTYSSRPGYSDHQTGLACDILSIGYSFDTFKSSKAFAWLSENAYKYGFILRYPEDKVDLTGYMYESWHYRYVGEDIAKYIYDHKLCYEEYYAYFIENNPTSKGI